MNFLGCINSCIVGDVILQTANIIFLTGIAQIPSHNFSDEPEGWRFVPHSICCSKEAEVLLTCMLQRWERNIHCIYMHSGNLIITRVRQSWGYCDCHPKEFNKVILLALSTTQFPVMDSSSIYPMTWHVCAINLLFWFCSFATKVTERSAWRKTRRAGVEKVNILLRGKSNSNCM